MTSKATASAQDSAKFCEISSHPAGGLAYSGDVSPLESFQYLSENGGLLVDVRTPEEWSAVGIPDMSDTAAEIVTISWKTNPGYVLNPDFAQQLEAALGGRKDIPLFFMCKGGGRSLDAAVAMTAAGYATCYNIAGGFEGRPDVPGWKALGLPSKQA